MPPQFFSVIPGPLGFPPGSPRALKLSLNPSSSDPMLLQYLQDLRIHRLPHRIPQALQGSLRTLQAPVASFIAARLPSGYPKFPEGMQNFLSLLWAPSAPWSLSTSHPKVPQAPFLHRNSIDSPQVGRPRQGSKVLQLNGGITTGSFLFPPGNVDWGGGQLKRKGHHFLGLIWSWDMEQNRLSCC